MEPKINQAPSIEERKLSFEKWVKPRNHAEIKWIGHSYANAYMAAQWEGWRDGVLEGFFLALRTLEMNHQAPAGYPGQITCLSKEEIKKICPSFSPRNEEQIGEDWSFVKMMIDPHVQKRELPMVESAYKSGYTTGYSAGYKDGRQPARSLATGEEVVLAPFKGWRIIYDENGVAHHVPNHETLNEMCKAHYDGATIDTMDTDIEGKGVDYVY